MQREKGQSHLQILCVHPGAWLSWGDPPPAALGQTFPPLPAAERGCPQPLAWHKQSPTHTDTPHVTSTPWERVGELELKSFLREKVKKKFNATPES